MATDTSITISAHDKTAATFKAVEGRLTSLSAKTAEGASKLAGVASFMGQSAGQLQGVGKAAELTSVGIMTLSGSMSMLGGPAGILLGAVAAIAAWSVSTESAKEKTKGWREEVERLTASQDDLQRKRLAAKIAEGEELITAQERAVLAMHQRLRSDQYATPGTAIYERYMADLHREQDALDALRGDLEKLIGKRDAIGAGGIVGHEQIAKEQERARQRETLELERAEQQRQRELAQSEERFRSLQTALLGEEQAIADSYYRRLAIIEETEANKDITDTERQEARFLAEQQYEQAITALHAQESANRVQEERRASAAMTNLKASVAQNAVSFLRALAPASKEAAIAGIAIEKAMAIASAKAATLAAANLAYASQLVPGDPSSPARAIAAANAAMTYGAANVALIAATGLAQAAGVMSGGAPALGSPGNPVSVADNTLRPPEVAQQSQQQAGNTIQIQFVGDVYGMDDFADKVVEVLGDKVNNGDTVIIGTSSRQAMELRGA